MKALCQMLGCSPYESSLAPIICMVGAILFVRRIGMTKPPVKLGVGKKILREKERTS